MSDGKKRASSKGTAGKQTSFGIAEAADASPPYGAGPATAQGIPPTLPATLTSILDQYRNLSKSEREKGAYFEKLIRCYLLNEPSYKDLYSDVWFYADFAKSQGLNAQDAGIDLVACTVTGEFHAVQCKLYSPTHHLQKSDIDSFFTASGKKTFSHRIIVSTTNHWSHHAEEALSNQHLPVTKIDLAALEASQIDWSRYQPSQPVTLKHKKDLLPHQVSAVNSVTKGLQSADRGKLLMACGTGKTFTSLKIAEAMAGPNGRVLFLVPSLALLSQALTEWTQESGVPLHSFAVCSDSDVGKHRSMSDDYVPILTHELQYPATTNAKSLAREMARRHDKSHMSVVFSTYHSIDVVADAQKQYGLAAFDLIICDEAHRTTGVIFEDEEESRFVRVHKNEFVAGRKRLYMTATPRIWADSAKASAERENVVLCSMDDPDLYGEQLYVLTFSNAVKQQLLVDYKVVVLAVDESLMNQRLQQLLADEDRQLKVDDAAKIVGCWKALAKQGFTRDVLDDAALMRRAVAFCQVIEPTYKGSSHKVSSKKFAAMFQTVVESYQSGETTEPVSRLRCEVTHIDGTMNASQRAERLQWLKSDPPENTCRILSNVRCLSEGVDVPALDAVLFLTPRNSQVDVVQSVGRVMRTSKASGKKRGYVILPVVVPAGLEPHEALNDNKTYAVVWQVLQALRSHDDRFNAMINKMDLELNRNMLSKMEIIAVTDRTFGKAPIASGVAKRMAGHNTYAVGRASRGAQDSRQQDLQFEIGEIEKAIYAKIVQKCGNRHHWAQWAGVVAKIARTHIDRITAIVENPANAKERAAFQGFAAELRDDLNDSITDGEVIEMLAQHLITKPVFDALFSDYSFASHNPISRAMQDVLNLLHKHRLENEADTLESFYAEVRQSAEGVESATGKQRILAELYQQFFQKAFPRLTDRFGIVYTPVEIVDFVIHSINEILQQEFGQTLGSKGVHIIDPFVGTGTFIGRLLQSGLIRTDELPHKYRHEIHANEIVLLAYYIAAINIESVYHGIVGGAYQPFEGICLTDTFHLYEKDDLISRVLVDNSARRTRQKKLDIRVILSNPPYFEGQDSENDNNANIPYPSLDDKIANTYVARSDAKLPKNLYNSYIRAIRWATDRMGDSGIIGFVTSAGFLEAGTTDGLRRCLAEEFSSIYVFHLRGNQRNTVGEVSKKEGGKIFGGNSRSPVAISLLVKNPNAKERGRIYFRDIGDYLPREEKLAIVAKFGSVGGITAANGWAHLTPDDHGDWLRQRDKRFDRYLAFGTKDRKDTSPRLFANFSLGVVTNRDAWAWNPSRRRLGVQMAKMIAYYNAERTRFDAAYPGLGRKVREARVDSFIGTDPTKISWTVNLKNELVKDTRVEFDDARIVPGLYRPFTKQWLYFDRKLNERVYQMPRIFPHTQAENRVIMVKQRWPGNGHLALMADAIPELQIDGGAQCFPLYLYDCDDADGDEDEDDEANPSLFAAPKRAPTGFARRDGITDAGLALFQSAYPGENRITKEDVFYYVYGVLHSADYRNRYAANLGKALPRVLLVRKATDFWSFSRAGRELGKLHVDYDQASEYPARVEAPARPTRAQYRVEKMKFGQGKNKSVIHYNSFITVHDVPLEAYDYVVNGKPAIGWVMERQSVTADEKSNIIKDANDWATETAGDARYPLSLLLRVITVSLETMRIVNALPRLDEGI